MSPELIAVFAVGGALAGLITRQGTRLDERIDRLEDNLGRRVSAVERDLAFLKGMLVRHDALPGGGVVPDASAGD